MDNFGKQRLRILDFGKQINPLPSYSEIKELEKHNALIQERNRNLDREQKENENRIRKEKQILESEKLFSQIAFNIQNLEVGF